MDKILGFIGFIVLLCISTLVMLFKTHVIMSLAELYAIPFITSLSFKTVFGTLYVINLAMLSISNDEMKNNDDFWEGLGIGFVKLIFITILVLLIWFIGTIAAGMF